MGRHYSTWEDAVYWEIEYPINSWSLGLAASDFDIEAIARECLSGDGSKGYFSVVSLEDFWGSVERHYIR